MILFVRTVIDSVQIFFVAFLQNKTIYFIFSPNLDQVTGSVEVKLTVTSLPSHLCHPSAVAPLNKGIHYAGTSYPLPPLVYKVTNEHFICL